jgi:hypothetical protein
MKNLKTILSFLLLACSLASAQTVLTTTTLSSAVASGDPTSVVVASATGIHAPSTSDPTQATILYVDREAMYVTAVSSTTISVIRGYESTAGRAHASSALVFVIPAYLDTYSGTPYGYPPAVPSGSCTRANELVLPRIQFVSGLISDCTGGQWVTGDSLSTTRLVGTQFFPPVGATLYTGLETNGTAFAASTTMYCQTIDITLSKQVTGAGIIMGTTAGGTERKAIALYDGSGNLLANQPTGSSGGFVPAGTASVVAKAAFVTPYYVVGPARYFACVQSNGTSDTIRHTITGVAGDQLFTSAPTGQTFGTYPATITAPTTFTTAQGPYILLY